MADTSLTVNGKSYPLRFTSNALRRLEQELGRPCNAVFADFSANNAGIREWQTMLWAGLEGARAKQGTRRQPFTLDEVGDLADEVEGWWPAIVPILMDAVVEALPKQDREGVGGGEDAEARPTTGTT